MDENGQDCGDPRHLVGRGDVGASGPLPTGTVTLLLADVEASTRLWETELDSMSVAIAGLDGVVAEIVAACQGARPVEQGEGDSFVVAFARASDAIACALELQRAGADPAAHRCAHRRGAVARRAELHGAHGEPRCAAPRPRARRPDSVVGR